MTFLDRWVADKFEEVAFKKRLISVGEFEKSPLFQIKTQSFLVPLRAHSHGIIGGFYRKHPWQESANQGLNVFEVAQAYEKGGLVGISIATDTKYFGGSLDDVLLTKAACNLPVLRKDIIIDSYQLYETKAYGADAVLFMASVLECDDIQFFTQEAHRIGLEVFLQVNDSKDLEKSLLCPFDVLVLSNRCFNTLMFDFQKFDVFFEKSLKEGLKISEGGIFHPNQVIDCKQNGYAGCMVDLPFLQNEAVFRQVCAFVERLS